MNTASCSLIDRWPTKSASRDGLSERSGSSSTPGVRMPLERFTPGPSRGAASSRGPQGAGDEILGGLAGRLLEQPVGLLGPEAQPHEALARKRPWVVGAADPDLVD